MIIRYIFMIIMGIALITPSVKAEFYRYKDKSGNLRFTDNIAEVPEDQREGVKKYKESMSTTPSQNSANIKADKQTAKQANNKTAESDPAREALEKEQAALNDEYASLYELYRQSKENPDLRKAYETRLEAYEKRKTAFEKSVKDLEEKEQKELAAKMDEERQKEEAEKAQSKPAENTN